MQSLIRMIQFFLLATASLFLLVDAAFADGTLRVYPGEYIIEPAFAGLGLDDDGLDEAVEAAGVGVKVVKRLGGKSRLISDGFAAAQLYGQHAATVPYEGDNSFCTYLLKENIARSCSPNFEIKISETPNDPKFSSLWGLSADEGIDAEGAWEIQTGKATTVVAVIDTGVDYTHPDLRDNMWVNTLEIPGNGVDDDGNGYIDDIHGMNALGVGAEGGNPMDDNGHGSHCAGTIGGRGNNGIGVVGVNWRVKIMALKFLSGSGAGSLAGAIEAIHYMVAMKKRGVDVRISNNSWGGGGFSQSLYEAITAANEAGILFVAAAGNAGNDNDAAASYPSSYDIANVVGVAAIDSSQNLASFSNYGATSVDIAAPGVSIVSTYKNGGYASLSGTSMAAPHVAGALGLMIAALPNLSNAELVERLYATASPKATLHGIVRTGRSVNIARALRNQSTPLPEPAPETPACEYRIEEIPYQPDTLADTAPLVNQSDEFAYAAQSIPFAFPFHRESVTAVTVSPNGLLYLKQAPTGMDYKNASLPPLNAIAALHSDLKGTVDPYGVRYAGTANKAVFFWKSLVYAHENLGEVLVRAVLHRDGAVDVFIDFTSDAIRDVVKNRATIGLNGNSPESAAVFAYNNEKIARSTAVRFSPFCPEVDEGDGDGVVHSLTAQGLRKSGRTSSTVDPKRWVRLQAEGVGNGERQVRILLDGVQCAGSLPLSMSAGLGQAFVKIPRVAKGYRKVNFEVDGVQSQVRISRQKNTKRYKRKFRKASSKKFKRACKKIVKSAR